MIFKILINNADEAQKLNQIATKYPYDIMVESKNGRADAKSLLGTMLLTMESDLKLVTPDGIDSRELEIELAPYIVKYV